MIVLLSIPLALGWALARYWLRLREWPAIVGTTLACAVVLTLVGTNFFYRQQADLARAVLATMGLQAAGLAVLLWQRPKVEAVEPMPRWARLCLGGLALLVLVYTNAQQIANPDDDYWIHTPLQGLMRHHNFPPSNPFFSDIPMNGHYGRNLGIVTFSYLSGADVFMSQHLLTSALQVVTLLLFFGAIRLSEANDKAALLGSLFIFFGINAGGRGGLIDTVQNNNAFVHMYLAFLLLLTLKAWQDRSKTAAVLGGLALGSYAIVYETHFGLVFFTIVGVTPILWALKRLDRRQVLTVVMMLVVSLPLAFTQGGPLTDLLDRRLEGRQHTQAENLSKGMQNQAQVVKVTFPKKELFQILLETGEYQRTSNIYCLDTPLKVFFKPSTKRGYAYIWSWDVLKIHFLALYLAPWSAFILFRRRSAAGLFLGAFGTISYLVPALVNFGPIYESEYYRWEFAASLGFAGALGIALASLLEQTEARPFFLSGSRVVIQPGGKRYLLVAAITALNSLASLHLVQGRLSQSLSWHPTRWLVFPSTQEWLASHPVLRFGYLDYQAGSWLEQQVKPGDRILVDFAEENNFSILYESTLTGLTGARCVGHALPLEDEKIGTTPFRRSPAAQLFWHTKRPDPLAQLQADWLFVHGVAGEKPPEMPASELVKTFKLDDDVRYIYKVDKSKLPKLSATYRKEGQPVPAEIVDLPKDMRGGSVYRYSLNTRLRPQQEVDGVAVMSTRRRSDGLISPPSEDLVLRVDGHSDGKGNLALHLPFVAPYDEGTYDLRVQLSLVGMGLVGEAEAEFHSDFQQGLKGIKLQNLEIPHYQANQLPTDSILTPRATLSLPDSLPQPREVLACWAFYSEDKAEFDQLPGAVLTRVSLSKELADVPLVTPHNPGTYRLSLYLSGGQGQLVRVLGRQVTVVKESL